MTIQLSTVFHSLTLTRSNQHVCSSKQMTFDLK